jgi:hypothetical protein
MVKTQEEINQCIQSQKELCFTEKLPHFAPNNGVCFKCKRNIYQNYEINQQISHGYNGKTFITGCPHCSRSYCD